MTKFKEDELTKILEEYENRAKIKLEFERAIDGKIELDNAHVKYIPDIGFIEIVGRDCRLMVNTTMVRGYEKEGNKILIDFEDILLKLV